MNENEKRVYFIGAGPGDPELITLKGARLISQADVIIYAGSLVAGELLQGAREGCEIYNSASLNLEEITGIIKDSVAQGKNVVRIHSGDPAVYGAVREQMDILKSEGIDFEIIPGVSSLGAAAAALKKEYTLPGVSQTVILTRVEGKTPVPSKERLRELSSHRASMAIFLSVHMIEEVVSELLSNYPADTPAAVVQKASWPEEKVVQGRLEDIAFKTRQENIDKSALVLVGDFLGNNYELSKLYDKSFSHGYRKEG